MIRMLRVVVDIIVVAIDYHCCCYRYLYHHHDHHDNEHGIHRPSIEQLNGTNSGTVRSAGISSIQIRSRNLRTRDQSSFLCFHRYSYIWMLLLLLLLIVVRKHHNCRLFRQETSVNISSLDLFLSAFNDFGLLLLRLLRTRRGGVMIVFAVVMMMLMILMMVMRTDCDSCCCCCCFCS
jgi:hypothetical protein